MESPIRIHLQHGRQSLLCMFCCNKRNHNWPLLRQQAKVPPTSYSTEASQHANNFITSVHRSWKRRRKAILPRNTAEIKRLKNLDQIVDEECNVSKQLLADAATTFNGCVQGIRTRQQELSEQANKALKKAQHFKEKENNEADTKRQGGKQLWRNNNSIHSGLYSL